MLPTCKYLKCVSIIEDGNYNIRYSISCMHMKYLPYGKLILTSTSILDFHSKIIYAYCKNNCGV